MTSEKMIFKVLNLCAVLRDDGMSCIDYLEQLTIVLFLKLVDEYSKPPHRKKMGIPKAFNWQSLTTRQGVDLNNHYHRVLKNLSAVPGTIGQIFMKVQNKIQDPLKLAKLIALIDAHTWHTGGDDLNGGIYEKLVERMAEDTKKGAGQYFTPRALIRVIVACMKLKPHKTIIDPACGTGGFLLEANAFIKQHYRLNKKAKRFLKLKTFQGNEIVASTRRLCLMNLFLQNIGAINEEALISSRDALVESPKRQYDYVLANPPFGRKTSLKVLSQKGAAQKDGSYHRPDFWVKTSNKALNFLQHIKTLLKPTGQAAVIVPDNVLFEGGAGETIRRKLLETTNLHTILRLPTGIFYATGVKTNVLFFDNKPAAKEPSTKAVWFYDYRTNIHHTLRSRPFQFECLMPFMQCYHAKKREDSLEAWSEENPNGRWRKFSYSILTARDKCNLELVWLKDKSMVELENLASPKVMMGQVIDGLQDVLAQFLFLKKELKKLE
jgi:type I restriction enzyme M protein